MRGVRGGWAAAEGDTLPTEPHQCAAGEGEVRWVEARKGGSALSLSLPVLAPGRPVAGQQSHIPPTALLSALEPAIRILFIEYSHSQLVTAMNMYEYVHTMSMYNVCMYTSTAGRE